MPLEKGREWTYSVRDPAYGSRVMKLTVAERARVGLNRGWLLTGEGGDVKLAWVRGELEASELPSVRFDPPITLLKPDEGSARWAYEGWAESGALRQRVLAEIVQEPAKLTVSGLERPTLLTTLRMRFGSTDIEFKTWFEIGEGILRQEQRNGRELVVALELVGARR